LASFDLLPANDANQERRLQILEQAERGINELGPKLAGYSQNDNEIVTWNADPLGCLCNETLSTFVPCGDRDPPPDCSGATTTTETEATNN